ncbi:MAG: hypothetical protein RL071_614 [Pseudomonadota bacterium]
MIALVGGCGLEAVAEALRAAGQPCAVLPDPSAAALDALDPALVYVDPVDGAQLGPLMAAALVGRPLDGLLAAAVAARDRRLAATEGRPRLLRGLRRPPMGAFGLLEGPPPALTAALQALAAPLAGQRTLDVQGLWARHGIIEDGVLYTIGHGEPDRGALGASRRTGQSAAEVEAAAVAAVLGGLRGPLLKLLAVDLDNTLVYGEIADPGFAARNPAWCPLGEAPVGAAEAALWMAPRGLHEALRAAAARGLLLALVTRNTPEVVRARFRRRPPEAGGAGAWLDALLLDHTDFIAIEASFGPKSAAIHRLCAGLGLHPRAVALLDDSAAERAEVEANGGGCAAWGGSADELRERLLTGAGAQGLPAPSGVDRAPSYRSRALSSAAAAAGEDAHRAFLMGLDLRLQLRRAAPGDQPRVLELLARSHQLRLTGDDALPVDLSEVYVLFARDRLADHGLVGVAWRGPGPGAPWAELAVSCRVLPQRVAGSALAALRALAPEAAVPYRPTGRNGAAAGLIAESADGIAPWVRLDGPAGATG